MSYLSIEFIVLFLIFYLVYWICRPYPRLQNGLLLLASYAVAYSFDWHFALILFAYSLAIYLLAKFIQYSCKPRRWFQLAIIAVVTNLAVFKYYDFFCSQLQLLINQLNIHLLLPSAEIIMPIGISFYTFHSISYLVSVYRGERRAASLLDVALFLSFFPSLVAGPINRAKDFLPQIQRSSMREVLEPYRVIVLILLAVIKVYWLSAWLAQHWVDPAFANPDAFHSLDLLLALYAYAIQLYCNFSGYTDLVTAIALLLGFRLPINFNLPYLACNLRDFWRRWHISLSTWIQDYIYIPLGGSRRGFARTQINVMVAMLLSGLWHGAGLNFIVWGAIHGIGMVLLNVGDRALGRHYVGQYSTLLAKLLTFNYVCFGWIFFRSATLGQGLDYLYALGSNFTGVELQFNSILYLLLLWILYCIYPLLALWPQQLIQGLKRTPWPLIPLVLISLLWVCVNLAPSGMPNFIYAGF